MKHNDEEFELSDEPGNNEQLDQVLIWDQDTIWDKYCDQNSNHDKN